MINFKYHTKITENAQNSNSLDVFKKIINNPQHGFFHLTDNELVISETINVYNKFKHKKTFIQIGIGGSALGPQMLVHALGKGKTTFHFLDNIDSDEIESTLDKLEFSDCIFYVVSKSGSTAETMAGFIIAKTWLLNQGVSESELNQYFVFCTDPKNGELRKYVDENKFENLSLATNIGGRFSVLSAVGMFPAIFAGIDIAKIFAGANKFKKQILNDDIQNNPLTTCAHHVLELFKVHGVTQTVFMPYSSKLKYLSAWFVQLWAESLGKENIGLTPIPAFGATDQHAQMQLFMEGPHDKLMLMIEVIKRKSDFKLTNNIKMNSCEKLKSHSLNQLMWAEFHGTLKALSENKRDFIHLAIEENSEENLGALVLFFESLTALVGQLMNVDPFNQPGVELGKKYAYQWLNTLA